MTLDNQAQEWKQKCLNDFKMGTDVDVLHASKVATVSTFICRIIELKLLTKNRITDFHGRIRVKSKQKNVTLYLTQ